VTSRATCHAGSCSSSGSHMAVSGYTTGRLNISHVIAASETCVDSALSCMQAIAPP
jgi:hypothetical protein